MPSSVEASAAMPLWRSWASQGSEPGSQTAPGFLDAQGYALEAQTQHVPLMRLRQSRQSLERATAVARLGAVGQEASRRRPAVEDPRPSRISSRVVAARSRSVQTRFRVREKEGHHEAA